MFPSKLHNPRINGFNPDRLSDLAPKCNLAFSSDYLKPGVYFWTDIVVWLGKGEG